ncbi:MAG: winged helix-turn-helix transcriptional regulator [Proteobacteria bacterium]|nr:winged helix-turn-helix transcriptional regulator [Pseudomonadota bacterium]
MTTKPHIKKIAAEVAGACACHVLRKAARKVSRLYDDALRSTGIKATQLVMLSGVALREGATLTGLAEGLGMDRTTLSRNLTPLTKNGWIQVSPEGYRRTRTVELTAKGNKVLEDTLPRWQAVQKSLRKKIGKKSWNAIQLEMARMATLL